MPSVRKMFHRWWDQQLVLPTKRASLVKGARELDRFQGTRVRPACLQAPQPAAMWFFEAALIPPIISLEPTTVFALSEADAALGHRQALAQLITDLRVLMGAHLSREAVARFRIEGARTSLAEVVQSEAGATSRSDDVGDVQTSIDATHDGLARLEELPISRRLAVEVHQVLPSGVRSADRRPGQLRRTQVWRGRRRTVRTRGASSLRSASTSPICSQTRSRTSMSEASR